MIKFEKVSFEEFCRACEALDISNDKEIIKKIYDTIKLPKRSTQGSAGYDFYSPFAVHLPGEQIVLSKFITATDAPVKLVKEYTTLPTGIRFITDRNDVSLILVPRSGLGFKYGMRLSNTMGVIDSDYAQSDNEGHIMAKIGSEKPVDIEAGKAFMQGIIAPYLTVDDEDDSEFTVRNGGFGSTDKK